MSAVRWLAAPGVVGTLPDTHGMVKNSGANAAALTAAFGPPTPLDYWWFWRGAQTSQWTTIEDENWLAAQAYMQAGYPTEGDESTFSPTLIPPVMRT